MEIDQEKKKVELSMKELEEPVLELAEKVNEEEKVEETTTTEE